MFLSLMACIIVTGVLGGGYYVSVSALMDIALLGILFYRMYIQKRVTAAWDLNMSALAVLVLGYMAACLWAVDSGMAPLGIVKFLPLLLFYVLVSGDAGVREELINYLPLMGCLMTVFSFVMMQFSVFEKWVSVAGRLAGFFQYPNTYALFMLICLILLVWRFDSKKMDWMDIVYGVSAVFGIALSGSRTVFVLTGVAVAWLLIARMPMRKAVVLILVTGGMITVVLAAAAGSAGVLERFANISLEESTFLGRVLYAGDALPVIVTHPFGVGYYGYYYIQQSIQTGVYSVVNVHNELLQLFLDVGVIPAAVMCAAVCRSLFSKRAEGRNRIVLGIMLLHSLLDYDFQFLIMGFVLILFLDMRNVKTYKVPMLTGTVVGLAGIGAVAFGVIGGISELCYMTGNHDAAIRVYRGYTPAAVSRLTAAETKEDMRAEAEAILQYNEYVSVAYSALAQAAFAEGDVEAFAAYKDRAIELAPYQFEEYEDYLQILAYCFGMYLQKEDYASAKFCVEKAETLPGILEEVKKKTSPIAWKIVDIPQLTLSHESLELIKEMRESLNE